MEQETNHSETMRHIGMLEGGLRALESRLQRHEDNTGKHFAEISGKLDELIAAMNMTRGGWWMATKMSAVTAAVAGVVSWIWLHVWIK